MSSKMSDSHHSLTSNNLSDSIFRLVSQRIQPQSNTFFFQKHICSTCLLKMPNTNNQIKHSCIKLDQIHKNKETKSMKNSRKDRTFLNFSQFKQKKTSRENGKFSRQKEQKEEYLKLESKRDQQKYKIQQQKGRFKKQKQQMQQKQIEKNEKNEQQNEKIERQMKQMQLMKSQTFTFASKILQINIINQSDPKKINNVYSQQFLQINSQNQIKTLQKQLKEQKSHNEELSFLLQKSEEEIQFLKANQQENGRKKYKPNQSSLDSNEQLYRIIQTQAKLIEQGQHFKDQKEEKCESFRVFSKRKSESYPIRSLKQINFG